MDPQPTPGTKWGSRPARYETAEELARLGPLRVVAAHDHLLNRTVAIAECSGTGSQRSAFTRQGQTVARISSQFVVDIYDCGLYDDRPFVVFERPSSTLAEVIEAGETVVFECAVRELQEAVLCLRLAGVEFGTLRPEVVGVNEAGQVRLSPWPLGHRGAAVTGDTESEEGRILALLAPLAGASVEDPAALRRALEQSEETVYSAPFLSAWSAGRLDAPPAEHPSAPAATAQVLVDRNVLSRPVITSHLAKRRRPRWHYLVPAAAIVAVAALGVAGSLAGQAGVPGMKNHTPAVTASNAGTSSSTRSGTSTGSGSPSAPVLSQTTNDHSTSWYGQPNGAPPSTPLVTPATNVVGASKPPGAAGTPSPSTTSTTVPAPTTTTTVPVTTTTTTVPATTTTTTSPAPHAPGP